MSVRPVTSKPAPLACAHLLILAGNVTSPTVRHWAASGCRQGEPERTKDLSIILDGVLPPGREGGVCSA